MGSKKHPTQSSHSSETCITNMLAEAMTEPQPTHQEQSPISSESEHTSGDELETTTSSDIEIISSPTPNGDSSSTTSRHSPSKLAFRGMSLGKIITGKMKGHHREPSETSSGGSDECTEVDKLLKRIAEMTEILEARESKLIDLSRLNADLQESNSELKSQLERHIESQEVRTMSEEFTQRMAALERKFQQAIREKDLLRKQLDHAKALATKREDDVDKDQLIAELRSEGEKLSKQQLTLNNTIKKLRASEKENSKTIATLREQLNDVTQELERCKKAVLAKEEMERSHIEAVHNLTKQNQQLEKELTNAKSNIAGLTSSLVSLQKEFSEKEEACKVLENKNAVERKEIENKIRNELASDLEAAEQQVLTLQSALEEMRRQILLIQEQHSQAEAAEQRAEEQAEALTVASQPLTRQLQALAESHSAASTAWQLHEAALNKTISELESRLTILGTSERSVREQYETVGAQLASLQDKMTSLVHQNNELNKELKESQESSTKIMKKYEMDFEKLNNEMCDTKRELITLQELLSVERAAVEAEKRKNSALQERLHSMQSRGSPPLSSASPRSSPTLSFGRVSVSDSVSSSAWPVLGEDFGESGSISGRIYEALRPCNNTSYLETLQAQVKLKEGEIQQLQWELSKLNADRNALSAEVSELTTQVSEQSEELESLSLLRTQYDALLQMYGEKLEESEELRMDLQDVKDMYKAQVNNTW
ncbi:hypothetical protein AAG570_013628 [Ranatra chinensis]|uniref:TATA element modulatory factor 1 TATA binding domain-containing protein n=1 Tax=Ranatra chinensis TaxID=642074 RepID=A0ABD0YRI3_9HEMI